VSAVVYEVNLAVDAAVLGEYRAWLAAHVAQILALPGFAGAQVWDVREPAPPPGEAHLCVQYRLRDADALEAYLRDHAPRLRAEGVARFGERARAQRRVLATPAD
jgi:hypothetical protein